MSQRAPLTPRPNSVSTQVNVKTTRAHLLAPFVFVLLFMVAFAASRLGPVSPDPLGISPSAESRLRSTAAAETTQQLTTNSPSPLDGSLNFARAGHSATALTDGKVLIAGGEDQNGFVTEAEIFDPLTGAFLLSGNLSVPRADHSATRLPDGRVLIAGGRGDLGTLNTTEIFDPESGTFTDGPNLSIARAGQSATMLTDGRIVLAGGDATGSIEIYEPASGAFSNAGAMSGGRSHHAAALMLDTRILFVGGRDADGNALTSGEIYDPANGSCTSVDGALAVPRIQPHLRVLFDGKVQVIGGSDDGSLEIYDPQINAFGAYVHVAPAGDTCAGLPAQIQGSQTRAALFYNGQSEAPYDRTRHTMTELGAQAIVTGGANTSGDALSSTALFNSSAAEISTDKLDYSPGQSVYITGRGFEPGETVRIKVHEDPHTPLERGLDLMADADGNFAGQYDVQEYDVDMKFLFGARGLTSGRTAQTAFTDASPGSLGNYATAGLVSSPVPISVAPSNVATNVTFSNLTRGSGLTGVGAANAFNSSNWTSSASPDANDYYEFTITPDSTYKFSASELRVGLVRSASGPANAVLRSSLDGYTANIGSVISVPTTIATSTINLSGVSGLQNSTSAVTLRLYAYGSTATAGTLRIQNITAGSPNVGLEVDGTVASSCATPSVTLQPANQTASYGDASVSFTSTASGTPAPTVQWQANTGSGFSNLPDGGGVSGATTTTLTISNPTLAMSGVQYRAVFTNTCGSVNSNAATLTVDKAGSTTTITCAAGSVYTGSAAEPCTYTVTGNEAGNPTLVGSTAVPSGDYTNNINAGVNTALASFNYPGDANHNGSSDTENFSIDKAGSTTTITCVSGSVYTGSAIEPCTYTVTGNEADNPVLAASTPVPSGDYTNNLNAGVNTASASFTYPGDANHTGSDDTEYFTIERAPSVTVVTCPASVVYNTLPQTPCTAVVTGAGGLNLSLTVVYANNVFAGTATAGASHPGDANHYGSSDSETFEITPRDALVNYIGQLEWVSSGGSATTAQVTLSASVRDPTGTALAGATMDFIDVSAGLPGKLLAGDVTVSPVANSSSNTGTANKIVTLSTGQYGAESYLILVRMTGNYDNTDQAILDKTANVVVSKPASTNEAIGAGTIASLATSAGTYRAPTGESIVYTVGMKYNKSGTNPQGKITVAVPQADGSIVYIKSNSISSMQLVSNTNPKMTIYTKSAVSRVDNLGSVTTIEGNVTLRMDIEDCNTANKLDDQVGFTVLSSKDSTLFYSNRWELVSNSWQTVVQTLLTGCVKIN